MIARLRQRWNDSLRFRLLALGLTPLLIAFPVVIAVLVVVGGERAESLVLSNLRASLAGSQNYLAQLKQDAGVRVGQLARSERLVQLLHRGATHKELDEALTAASRGSGLDFLVITLPDGRVIGSSAQVLPTARLPDTFVVRQARIGVANAAFERVERHALASFSADLPARTGLAPAGLMINAAAHFPLAANDTDAILVGGILLNENISLIEHLREIIFPVGTLPGDVEGMTSLFLDTARIAVSRQRGQGSRDLDVRVPPDVAAQVLEKSAIWLGHADFGGERHVAGYEPIVDGEGKAIGMIGVSIPNAPYRKAVVVILSMIGGLLALTLLAISLLYLGAGRELAQRLGQIVATMNRIKQGERAARVGTPSRPDELGQLARHFDGLLDTLADQDAVRRAALKAVGDEASRRRALFEHERDGVAILHPDGRVFEANPKCAEMLGYSVEELSSMRLIDWDIDHSPNAMARRLADDNQLFETRHRRKDGRIYPAEVSISHAQWGEQSFIVLLQRDISERKAAEAELAQHRDNLARLVDERTRELDNRSEQLNAIFTLSPDGFVTFDANRCVSSANRAFLHMSGLTLTDVIGIDEAMFSERLVRRSKPDAPFPGVAALRAARRKPAPEGGEETGDARRGSFELAAPWNRSLEVAYRKADAENVTQILYFRDVTHEAEVDRMKSEFLSTAAHELRTPMQSIFGYSELLTTQEIEPELRAELLATIHRNSELMVSIVNELLDLARIEARRGKDFVVEPVAIHTLVRQAAADFKPPENREAPRVGGADAALMVNGDRNKLRQVLFNVLSNAYKYSPEGATVEIGFRRRGGDGDARIGIDVRDRGIGMTPAQLARVFERFYRADASGKVLGAGLGMSIVREIVALHGGEVELASEVGAGTTATIWLPLRD